MSQPVVFSRGESDNRRNIVTIPQETAPIPNFNFLISIPLPYKQAENGFHAGKELDRIYDLEEKLIETLESPSCLFVGHVSRPGVTTIYFYSHSQLPTEITLKFSILKKAVVKVECRPDSEWLFYKHELEPTKLEFHAYRNLELHDVFTKQGDNPEAPRPVDFGLLFPTELNRNAFLQEAKPLGFTLSSAGIWGGPDDLDNPQDDYWCEIVKTTSIEENTIAQICVDLDELSAKHSGELDGWACPVMKA